ncbi:heat shock transcription factor, Y-linked-like [Vicugna pacos]|uniref:Heat shock transcription factor, Y-linked-like n=1 Tax=Vicugna pacos TaxID=30538 RepID=A0ABM5CY20_VICPA
MAHVSSEIQDVSPENGPTGSGNSGRSLLCDQTFSGDLDLTSIIEENAFQTLSEESLLQFYHNPSFKRGCPQLLVRIKRRVVIKNASLVSLLSQDFNKKHFKGGGNFGKHNSDFVAYTSGESAFLPSPNLNMALIRKPSTGHVIGDTNTPIRGDFSPPSSMSVRPPEQIAVNQCAILNQLTTVHGHSQSSYTEANDHVVNFITTTTCTSQYSSLSPLQSNYFGLMVEPSTFPNICHNISANEGRLCELQLGRNPRIPVTVIADTSATSLSRPTHQPSLVYERHPNCN